MNTPTQPQPTRKEQPAKVLISRQEVARLIDSTPDQVRRNEKRWGIKRARRDLSPRCVRYRTDIVWAVFKANEWV